jgi:Rrf2 family protein
LSKVLQLLVRGQVVNSQRGLGGGFTLTKSAKKLTVLDVMNAVDPIQRITECPLKLDAHAVRLCALHHRLDEAMALMQKAFAKTSIAELMTIPKGDNLYTFPPKKKASTKKRKS